MTSFSTCSHAGRKPFHAVALAAAIAAVSACSVGPDYRTPETPAPAKYGEQGALESAENSAAIEWWKSFGDETLNDLISRAMADNKEISVALAKVNESRALAKEAFAGLFPTFSGFGTYDSTRVSGSSLPSGLVEPYHYELWRTGVDTSWEIDLFGRVRRSVEAADAQNAATEAALQDALRITAAEVANAYFQLRDAQAQLNIARSNIAAQEETVKLVTARQQAGAGSELDTVQANAQLASTRAAVPPLEAAEKTAIHRLSVLIGKEPNELKTTLSDAKPLPSYQGPLTIGSPAEMLKRRPDLRAAERQLAAATALVGVATGNLFPRVTFEGTLDVEATSPENWTKGAAGAYTFGPRITWTLLDFGAVRARINAADARTQQALAAYESAVLRALEEVENSLVAYDSQRRRHQQLAEAAHASERAYELSRKQFEAGAVDLLRVLEAQRTMLLNQAAFTSAATDINQSLVAIYKALGGGWEGYGLKPDNSRQPAEIVVR